MRPSEKSLGHVDIPLKKIMRFQSLSFIFCPWGEWFCYTMLSHYDIALQAQSNKDNWPETDT
jgi:hypothetical protein